MGTVKGLTPFGRVCQSSCSACCACDWWVGASFLRTCPLHRVTLLRLLPLQLLTRWEQVDRRCPTATQRRYSRLCEPKENMAQTKPKTSPKAIKFLFGGLAGYVPPLAVMLTANVSGYRGGSLRYTQLVVTGVTSPGDSGDVYRLMTSVWRNTST